MPNNPDQPRDPQGRYDLAGKARQHRASAPPPAAVAVIEPLAPYVDEKGFILCEPGTEAPYKEGAGSWRIEQNVERWHKPGYGYRSVIGLGRQASSTANRIGAAIAMQREADGETVDLQFAAICESNDGAGESVTLMVAVNGTVKVMQGVASGFGADRMIQLKSARGKGYYLRPPMEILAVESGWRTGQVDEMAARWKALVAATPAMQPASFDHIPACPVDGHPPREIAAAYVLDGPDFGQMGDRRGSVFFATDFDAENDVVSGYHWFPDQSGLESEHGSMYGRDLRRSSAMVRGTFEGSGLTFGEVMKTERRTLGELMPALRSWTGQEAN